MSAEWTFLVYMAADNNLERMALSDLEEMAKGVSGNAVNVVVEIDTHKSQRMKRLRIHRGVAEVLADGPGIDTGDPARLTEFIDWGLDTFPARYSALVIFDHGGGWEDPRVDPLAFRRPRPSNPIVRHEIADDFTSKDYLTDQELLLAVAKTKRGRVDVFACDACLMAMLEIAYEMRETCSFMVASEDIVGKQTRWDYRSILRALSDEPWMSPRSLAAKSVTLYGERYEGKDIGRAAMSAVETQNLEPLALALDDWATNLTHLLKGERDNIGAARQQVLGFGDGKVGYLDLGDLVTKVTEAIQDDKLTASGHRLRKALGHAVSQNWAYDGKGAHATGLSVFFPNAPDDLYSYGRLALSKKHRWGGFLRAYFASPPASAP